MIRTASRLLSAVVIGVILWKVWPPTGEDFWLVTLEVAPIATFIWFPDTVDEWAFGTWRYGNTIDTHTPPVLIAAIGWLMLLVYMMTLVKPDFISDLFING